MALVLIPPGPPSDLIAVAAFQLGGKNTFASILVTTPEGRLIKSLPLPMLV